MSDEQELKTKDKSKKTKVSVECRDLSGERSEIDCAGCQVKSSCQIFNNTAGSLYLKVLSLCLLFNRFKNIFNQRQLQKQII